MLCSDKRRFPNKIKAVARAVVINNRNGMVIRRAYRCKECGAWHLTHKKQPWEKGKQKANKDRQRGRVVE